MRMWDNFLQLKWNSDNHVNHILPTGVLKWQRKKNSLVEWTTNIIPYRCYKLAFSCRTFCTHDPFRHEKLNVNSSDLKKWQHFFLSVTTFFDMFFTISSLSYHKIQNRINNAAQNAMVECHKNWTMRRWRGRILCLCVRRVLHAARD